jgi:hypothetical protein
MGAAAIARGDYLPDRALDLSGVAAYDREKQKCMKDLGLVTKDNRITQRLQNYMAAMQGCGDRIALLRQYGLGIKLQGPQIMWRSFSPGNRQMGYAHYRIRPFVMFLYALQQGIERTAEVTTDDLALSAFRLFVPMEQDRVDEQFVRSHVDQYFQARTAGHIDFEHEFREQFRRVEQEIGIQLTHRHAFEQKCRNSANEVSCTSLFLKRVGLIDYERAEPAGWSCTQMSYGRTGSILFAMFRLTELGQQELGASLERVPVWGKDIVDLFPQEWWKAVEVVNRLGRGQKVRRNHDTDTIVNELRTLGVEVRLDGSEYVAIRRPEFDLQYDLV